MTYYRVVKVFDLSRAPLELRDSDDLAPLRPSPAEDDAPILSLKVGQDHSLNDGPFNDSITREVTLAEYQLHRWLTEQGADEGESVLLRWNGLPDR